MLVLTFAGADAAVAAPLTALVERAERARLAGLTTRERARALPAAAIAAELG